MKIQIVLLLISITTATVFNYSCAITTNYYYSSALSTCKYCDPTKNLMLSANKSSCICLPGYIPSNLTKVNYNSCVNYSTLTCSNQNAWQSINENGSYLYSSPSTSCLTCANGFIPNPFSVPPCVWCGLSMSSSNGTCTSCSSGTQGIGGCYPSNYTFTGTSNNYGVQLPKAVVGCNTYNDQLSCSFLMNLCVFTLLDTSSNSVCNAVNTNMGSVLLTSFSNSFTKTLSSSQLSIMLARYLPTGNYVDSKSLQYGDILICSTSGNSINLKPGNNIAVSCNYNFNNIINSLISFNFTNSNYVYSMFIADGNNNYQLVPVYINSNTVPASRFFIIDTFSVPYQNKLSYISQFSFQITLNSNSQLVSPRIDLTYSNIQTSGTIGSSNTNTVSYTFSYSYDTTSFNSAILPIFIVLNIVILIHVSVRTYVATLNKRSVFTFFLFLLQTWSSYMFIFLVCVTAYWFFFTKLPASIYILMPKATSFYTAFYVVLALMVIFRLIALYFQKSDSLKSEVYVIDWEKGMEKNSWRQMFIINNLVKFYTTRTVSFFWIVAWTVFFMVGLSWEKHSSQISSLNLSDITYNPMNPVLLFFLSSSIMLATGIVMKVLRRIVIIWWPLPFEDFLDFCSLANISLLFIKRNYPIGYYIHASNPQRSEANFKQINQTITKGAMRKQRNFLSDAIAASNEFQAYILYLHNDFQSKLTQIRRTEDMAEFEVAKPTNYSNKLPYKKIPYNIREEFAEKYIKKILQTIPQQRNQLIQKTFVQSFFGIPPINLNQNRQLPTFLSDKQFELINIFPNNNQLRDLVTLTILFSLFNVLTYSSAISAFLAYLIMEIVVHYIVERYAKKHIQKYTKVKQGFML